MAHTCTRCSRLNPAEAVFCYFDGIALPGRAGGAGPIAVGAQRFPSPFVFTSGQTCGSFDELALRCQQHWPEAKEVLQKGYLESFLGGLGRADLALAAREAARFPDPDRGLDQLLSKLPTQVLEPPKLGVEPPAVNLGQVHVGQERRFELRLYNQGMRLLYGSVTCDNAPWLALGEAPGAPEKLFDFTQELVVPVHVRGQQLRAGLKPLEGRLVIESNGGTAAVAVTVEVPAKPFGQGVLAGAKSPRQLAEKAKAAPKEAAVFLENGAVKRWYQDNGWTYPIQAQPASGLGAVQQFFEALGLTPPPKVEISERVVTLQGNPGGRVQHLLEVKAQEKRPVWAHAASDQPWLEAGQTILDGRIARILLVVPVVPDRPSETVRANVAVVSNGNQRFVVLVTLAIGTTRVGPPQPALPVGIPADPVSSGVQAAPAAVVTVPVLPGLPTMTAAPAVAARPVQLARPDRPAWVRLLPAGLLALVLLGFAVRDIFFAKAGAGGLGDTDPRIVLHFHDGTRKDELDKLVPEQTMRFGLTTVQEKGGETKRLIFDEWGRTNNTCLRLDGEERLFGAPPGRWQERETKQWKDDAGKEHTGMKSVWAWDDRKLQVTQFVEVVPGELSGLLDTCLVRYLIENRDDREHSVGLRFLLDTFIGTNDGVPFTIPGETDLCTDNKDFRDTIPEFIQALEREDLANPGTVAHLKLKLGGNREPPSRVTLGAWPDDNLQTLLRVPAAKGPATMWDVPVLPMKTLFPYDSAVVIYWNDKPVPAGGKREVGFAYGLGSVSSSGKLLVTVDGSFKPGGDLTVTALVSNPAADETVTLNVPDGFQIEGGATRKVPERSADADSRNRPVTWKVKAGPIGKHTLTVRSSTGDAQSQTITIKANSIFD